MTGWAPSTFYNPGAGTVEHGHRIILDHIEMARAAGLPFVYLGYWVPGNRKMDYKARFSALEIYKGGVWQPIGDPARTAPTSTRCPSTPSSDRSPTSRCRFTVDNYPQAYF